VNEWKGWADIFGRPVWANAGTRVMFQRIWRNAARKQAAPLFWVLLLSDGHVIKTEKNFAVAPSAKGNRPPESGQAENERNEGQHYLLK
jgi:hypothetical protein